MHVSFDVAYVDCDTALRLSPARLPALANNAVPYIRNSLRLSKRPQRIRKNRTRSHTHTHKHNSIDWQFGKTHKIAAGRQAEPGRATSADSSSTV